MRVHRKKQQPTVRSLKLQFFPEPVCHRDLFLYCIAEILHTMRHDTPSSGAWLQTKTSVIYWERSGIEAADHAVSPCTNLEEDMRRGGGGCPKAVQPWCAPLVARCW